MPHMKTKRHKNDDVHVKVFKHTTWNENSNALPLTGPHNAQVRETYNSKEFRLLMDLSVMVFTKLFPKHHTTISEYGQLNIIPRHVGSRFVLSAITVQKCCIERAQGTVQGGDKRISSGCTKFIFSFNYLKMNTRWNFSRVVKSESL